MSVPLRCVLCVSRVTHFSNVATQNWGQVPFQVSGNSVALCDLKHSSEMVEVLFDDVTHQLWKEKGLLLFDFMSLYLFIDQELF